MSKYPETTTIEEIDQIVKKVFDWLGPQNVVWFRRIKRWHGKINTVLKLNVKRKGIPVHPIHLREGIQIRNYMRSFPECAGWSDHDFDNTWTVIIDLCIEKLPKK